MRKTILFFLFFSISCIKHPIASCQPGKNQLFNICFLQDGTTQTTTFYKGYTAQIHVPPESPDYLTSQSQIISNIKINTLLNNISNDQVSVTHSFSNLNDADKTINLGIHASLQFDSYCIVPITKVKMDGLFLSYNGYDLSLQFPKIENQPDVSTLWLGHYSGCSLNVWKPATESFYDRGESGIAYSWMDILLKKNETKTVSMNFFNYRNFPSENRFSPSQTFSDQKTETQTDSFSEIKTDPIQILTKSQTFSDKATITQQKTQTESFSKIQTQTFSEKTISTKFQTDSISTEFTQPQFLPDKFSSSQFYSQSTSKTDQSQKIETDQIYTQIKTSNSGQFQTSLQSSWPVNNSSNGAKKSKLPMIIGIVCGIVAVLLAVVLAALFFFKKKIKGRMAIDRKKEDELETEPDLMTDINSDDLNVGL